MASLMEWLVLVLFAALAAAVVGAPLWSSGRGAHAASEAGATDLVEEHGRLLAELRELDEDEASGRISAAERQSGRRALAPRLRAVTEALREAGFDARAGA